MLGKLEPIRERKVIMSDFGDFGSCHECGERGTHSSDCNLGKEENNISTGRGLSFVGGLLCELASLVVVVLFLQFLGLETSDVPGFLIFIIWVATSFGLMWFVESRL